MGRFDTIHFLADTAPRCAAGHLVREVQTKDLECAMLHYYVFDDRLFVLEERGEPEPEFDGDDLVLVRRDRTLPDTRTAEVQIYATCPVCKPVLSFRGRGTLSGDMVQEHCSWHDWSLGLDRGRVTSLERMAGETRAGLREELLGRGLDVLDDDDRLARRHFEARGERPGAGWLRRH